MLDALKRQELNQSVSDRGGLQRCSSGQFENADVILSFKACKPVLVVNKIKLIAPVKKFLFSADLGIGSVIIVSLEREPTRAFIRV